MAWTYNSSDKWKMIKVVFPFLNIISITVPCGMKGHID